VVAGGTKSKHFEETRAGGGFADRPSKQELATAPKSVDEGVEPEVGFEPTAC
jgi:hypothetical protein